VLLVKEEGRRKKEEGRRKKEEGRGTKEEGIARIFIQQAIMIADFTDYTDYTD
jgi:hypothetical protein